MPWTSLPVSQTLLHMVKLWILASLSFTLILGLGLWARARKRNRQLEKVIQMQKDATARPRIPLLTRAK